MKYKESVRDRLAWLKLTGSVLDIRKYVDAKNNRNSGAETASASIARMAGYSELRIKRSCQVITPATANRPTTRRAHALK